MAGHFIFSGNPHLSIDKVLDEITDLLSKDLFGCLIVLPSSLMVRRVNIELLKRTGSLLGRPAANIRELVEHIFEDTRSNITHLDDPLCDVLIGDIIRNNVGPDHPLGGVRKNIEHWVPEIRDLFHTLERYRLDHPACIKGEMSAKQALMGDLYRHYLDALRRLSSCDEVGMFEEAVKAIKDGRYRVPSRLYLFGLPEMNPVEWALVNALCEKAEEVHMYQWEHLGSSAFLDASSNLNGLIGVEEHVKQVEGGNALEPGLQLNPSLEIKLGKFKDDVEELRSVATRIRELLDDGVEASSIAVLVPDRAKMIDRVEQVFDDMGVPFDLNNAWPLMSSPLARTLMHLGDVVNDGYAREDVVRLVTSPYVKLVDRNGDRVSPSLIRRVAKRSELVGGKGDWFDCLERTYANEGSVSSHDSARAALDRLFAALDPLEGEMTPTERTKILRLAIKCIGAADGLSKDIRTFDREMAAFRSFMRVLDDVDLGDRLFPAGPEDLTSYQKRLTLACDAAVFEPHGAGIDGVIVAGLRTAYLTGFDHVFLIDIVDGDMPYLRRDRPLIHEEDARQMGLMTLRDQLRQEKGFFLSSLCSARKSVHVTAHLSADGRETIPSQFYHELSKKVPETVPVSIKKGLSKELSQFAIGRTMVGDGAAEAGVTLYMPIPLEETWRRMDAELVQRRRLDPSHYNGFIIEGNLLDLIRKSELEDRDFSAKSLGELKKCRFRYFMGYVAKVRDEEHLDEENESRGFGKLFHTIAFRFYDEWTDKLTDTNFSKAEDKIATIAREELDKMFLNRLTRKTWEVYLTQENGLLNRFLNAEKQNGSPLRVDKDKLELEFGRKKRSDGSYAGERLLIALSDEISTNINGTIDRMDVGTIKGIIGQQCFIFDYKTGDPDYFDSSIQLTLYVEAARKKFPDIDCFGAGFYSTRKLLTGEVPYVQVLANGDKKLKEKVLKVMWPKISNLNIVEEIEGTLDLISSLLRDVQDGKFVPLPIDTDVCEKCSYRNVCRYSKLLEVADEGGAQA